MRASTRCTVGRDELQSATLPDHRSMDEEVESPSSVTMCCAIARSGVTKSNTRSKSSTPNRRSRRLPTDGHRLVGIKVNPSWRGEERQTACRVLVLCRAARHGSHSILSIRAMGGAVGRAAGDGAGTAQSPEQRQRERVESNRTACTCMLVSTLCRHGRSSSRVYARANRIRGASRENLHHRRNHTAILCLCTVQQSSRANQSGKMAFKRPFHAQSRTPVRSSDLRRLRDALASQFTALADQPDALKRLTADLQVCKATTHLDEPCTLYTAPNGDPRFFKLEDQAPPLVPTCYATDLVPAGTLLPVLGTAEPVVQNLISGSALFAAGVSPSHLAHLAAQTSPPVRAGDLVGITVASDPTQRIVAVGYLAADPKDIQQLQEQDKGGRAVLTLHARGDFLWQSGSKVDAPLPEPQVRKADNGGGNDALADRLAATSLSRSPSSASSSAASTSAPAPAEPSRKQKKGKDKKERHGGKNGLVPVDAEEEEQPAADETRESVTAAAAAELTPAEIDTSPNQRPPPRHLDLPRAPKTRHFPPLGLVPLLLLYPPLPSRLSTLSRHRRDQEIVLQETGPVCQTGGQEGLLGGQGTEKGNGGMDRHECRGSTSRCGKSSEVQDGRRGCGCCWRKRPFDSVNFRDDGSGRNVHFICGGGGGDGRSRRSGSRRRPGSRTVEVERRWRQRALPERAARTVS